MWNLKVKFLLQPVINVMQFMQPAVPSRFPTPVLGASKISNNAGFVGFKIFFCAHTNFD